MFLRVPHIDYRITEIVFGTHFNKYSPGYNNAQYCNTFVSFTVSYVSYTYTMNFTL